MAWLTSLLRRPEPAVEAEPEPEVGPAPASGPELAVLVPDVAGISSFGLRRFPAASAAAEHIVSLRTEVRQGMHAFWALHEKPIVNDSVHVEALVLIRAAGGSDLVYVVSFMDIESALSFTRFEVRRGLELGNVMVYWAAFVNVREELNGVTITPSVAPSTRPSLLAPATEPAPEASVAVAEPETEIISPVEEAAREAVQEYLRLHEEAEDRAFGVVVEDSAAVLEPPPVHEPLIETPVRQPEPVEEPEPISAPEDSFQVEIEEQPLEVDIPTVFQHAPVEQALRAEAIEAGMLVDDKPDVAGEIHVYPADEEAEPEPQVMATAEVVIAEPEPETEVIPVETFPGDEERESFRPLTAEPAKATTADPTADLPETPKFDEFDIAYEVQRFLQNRRARMEKRDGPFSGFDSPPGRF